MKAFPEDSQLIDLFWDRDEAAISGCHEKYGSRLRRISLNIVADRRDCEECLNDTYLNAWNSIPPQKPCCLFAYLGRIIRNLSFNVLEKRQAQKRGGGVLILELTDCLPAPAAVEDEIDGMELTAALARWLTGLPRHERILFLRRYWYGDSLKALSEAGHIPERRLSGLLFRLRKSLRTFLEKEGIVI